MLPYIFHVSLLITTCYLLYRFLWEKETYFRLNRWILITCLLLSFGLPLLTVPVGWSLQHRVVQQEIPTEKPQSSPALEGVVADKSSKQSTINVTKENVSEAVILPQVVTESPAKDLTKPGIVTESKWTQWSASLDFWQIIQYIYFGGIIIFILNFLIQLALIFFQKATNPTLQDGQFTIVEINQDKAPFSFGNSIFQAGSDAGAIFCFSACGQAPLTA